MQVLQHGMSGFIIPCRLEAQKFRFFWMANKCVMLGIEPRVSELTSAMFLAKSLPGVPPDRDFARSLKRFRKRRGNNQCGIPRHESSCLQIESLLASCQPQRRSEIQVSMWFASTGNWAATKYVTLCHQHNFTADCFLRFKDGLWLLHLQDRIFLFKSLHIHAQTKTLSGDLYLGL